MRLRRLLMPKRPKGTIVATATAVAAIATVAAASGL